jgi:hypothetical protein
VAPTNEPNEISSSVPKYENLKISELKTLLKDRGVPLKNMTRKVNYVDKLYDLDGHVQATPCRFLDVPRELRLMIYTLVLNLAQNEIVHNISNDFTFRGHLRAGTSGLLRVCKQINAECADIHFSQAEHLFVFNERNWTALLSSPRKLDLRCIQTLTVLMNATDVYSSKKNKAVTTPGINVQNLLLQFPQLEHITVAVFGMSNSNKMGNSKLQSYIQDNVEEHLRTRIMCHLPHAVTKHLQTLRSVKVRYFGRRYKYVLEPEGWKLVVSYPENETDLRRGGPPLWLTY